MRRPLAPTLPPRARRSNGLAVRGGSFLLVRLQAKTGGFVRSTADGNVSAAAAAARAASASPSSSSSSCSPSAVAPALKSGAESGRSSLGSLRKDTNPGGDSSGGGAAMGEFSVGVGGGGVCGRHGGGAGGKGGVGGGGGGSADHWILMQEVRER